jgi:hypothetical protein
MLPKCKTLAVLSAFLLLLSTNGFSQKNDTVFYTILMTGTDKGALKSVQKTAGSYENWYEFNDRGRGDSLHIIYRQDNEGFPTYIHIQGKDYFKKPVTEDFSLTNGNAQWKNNGENERVAVKGKAFYVSLQGSCGNIIKALKSNHNKIKLLPFGEASLKVLLQHTIGSGVAARKLTLCSVSGFNFVPDYYWVDEQDHLFAVASEWFAQVLRGYESYVPELIAIQKKIEHDRNYTFAKELPEKVAGNILVKNVTLFDAENARQLPHTDVLIGDGIIKEVSVGKAINTPAARVIDGSGHTLLPGLWDMHVHFTEGMEGILHLAAGVMHVRDMGNDTSLLGYVREINNGELIGPKVEILSGLIDGAGPYAAPVGTIISNVEEGKKFIAMYAGLGYHQIKFYSSIKPEWLKPLIAEARKYNLRVCGHIPAYMLAEQAIETGYNEVTHMNMLVLNFFRDTIDTRTPQRFLVPANKAAGLDLNSKPVKDFIALMKAHDITTDPTLVALEPIFVARDGVLEEKNRSIIKRFPLQIQRTMRAGGGGLAVPPGMDSTFLKSFDKFLKLTKLLYDSGIRIVAGSDGTPGFDLHRELELYVKAGIPAEKVLQLATYGAAVYTGKSKSLGSISVGKVADLVLVAGDPVKNISDIRHTKLVIREAVIYDTNKLYKAVSIEPF